MYIWDGKESAKKAKEKENKKEKRHVAAWQEKM